MTTDAGVRGVVHEHPAGAPLLDADEMRPGQPAEPFPQRGPADAELTGELVLGPDPVARPQAFAVDVQADLTGDLLACVRVNRREADRLARIGGRCHTPSLWPPRPPVCR